MIRAYPAKAADALTLILREEDQKEVSDGWRERIIENLASTYAFVDDEGRLVALGGVQKHPGIATPWLLCSPLVARYRASAFRLARLAVGGMRLRYRGQTVGNFIPKDAHANRRFVTALGFSILSSPSGFDFFFLPHV